MAKNGACVSQKLGHALPRPLMVRLHVRSARDLSQAPQPNLEAEELCWEADGTAPWLPVKTDYIGLPVSLFVSVVMCRQVLI